LGGCAPCCISSTAPPAAEAITMEAGVDGRPGWETEVRRGAGADRE